MVDCNIFNLFLASCLECVGNRRKDGPNERERDAEMKRERVFGGSYGEKERGDCIHGKR